jgi:hypothetical protein
MFNMDDPKIQMQLAMAAGLLSPVRGKGIKGFGEALSQGLLGGIRGYNVADEAQRRNQSVDMQNKMQQSQYDQMQRGLLGQQKIDALAPQFFQPGNAPADGMGPVLPPKQDFGGYAQAVTGIDPMKGMALQSQLAQMNKPAAPVKLGRDDRLVDPTSGKALVDAQPPDWQNPEWVATQERIRRAGKTDVTTNVLPQRQVFKDSLDLKKDFDSTPEVKGFKEVRTAWDQISTALQNPSAANDLAAATKFMKLLDPGSVVRESELAMAMQASGALDRFMNTANRLKTGQKLTPQQRVEFHESGKALYDAAEGRYNQTVGQYEGLAGQYGLDAGFLKPPAKSSAAPKVGTVDGDYYFKGGDPSDQKNWVKRR